MPVCINSKLTLFCRLTLLLICVLLANGCRDNEFVRRETYNRRLVRRVDTSPLPEKKASTLVELIGRGEPVPEADPVDTDSVLKTVYAEHSTDRAVEKALFETAEAAFKDRKYRRAYVRYRVLIDTFPRTKQYALVIERIFTLGRESLEDGSNDGSFITFFGETDAEFGVRILDYFVYRFNRHPRADNALYLIANQKLEDYEPEDAIELWTRLIEEYPDSEFLELSQLRIPLARLKINDDERRDKTSMRMALKELREYLKKYRNGDNATIAKQVLEDLEYTLSQQELTVAKRYRRLLQPSGYKIYLEHVIFEFPGTEAAIEAKVLLERYEKFGAGNWGSLDRFGIFLDR